MKKNIKEY